MVNVQELLAKAQQLEDAKKASKGDGRKKETKEAKLVIQTIGQVTISSSEFNKLSQTQEQQLRLANVIIN